jgi:hypothetical protein
MHTMMIESERAALKATNMTFESQGTLAEADHEVPIEFEAFTVMCQGIRNEQAHHPLHDDLVE